MSISKRDILAMEDNPLYHNTYRLLKIYRDAVWSLELSAQQVRKDFELQYGQSVEDFLNSVYYAGADLGGTDIESQARTMQRTQKMLNLINNAVDLLRRKHKRGEYYYWLLYFCFLSPQELDSVDDILDALRPYVKTVARSTYYECRTAAINALSDLLWGYTSKDCLNILNSLLPRSEK